ncbi:TetR/AcrR family transcriptional regulator [Microbacterium panaciterrae]|uniref:HTH tetR-type domain-containing protein n=1 Tax=Microbacterium panaciterrae TaxID=985759 RepID=A0ABP8PQG3_9MICO
MTALTGPHRAALIEATVAEFAAAGYEGASLNRILRAAALSKSSFYHAAGSKAELFDAVVRALVDDVRAVWVVPDPAGFDAPDFWARVDSALAGFAALAGEPALAMLGRIFYLPAQDGTARTEVLGAVRSWVAAVLAAGRSAGAVHADLPIELQTAAVFGLLRGIDEWALSGDADAAEGARAPGILLRRMLGVG